MTWVNMKSKNFDIHKMGGTDLVQSLNICGENEQVLSQPSNETTEFNLLSE